MFDWKVVAAVDAVASADTPAPLQQMLASLVDALGQTDEEKKYLAAHLAEVYRGSSDNDTSKGELRRTFCALPCMDSDEQLALSTNGQEYLRLRDLRLKGMPNDVVVDPVVDPMVVSAV